MNLKVMMVFGTRPEAIKMAPLARLLQNQPDIDLHICSTGQHREMLASVISAFDLHLDEDLDVMTRDQTLNGLSKVLLEKLDQSYQQNQPDIVLVHGDTTTSFIACLAAFHRHIPVAHIEAGLRTGDLQSPWPEEANRRLTGVLANLHFPPTEQAKLNLLSEGIFDNCIVVTGNTVIDALLWMKNQLDETGWQPAPGSPLTRINPARKMVLITGHRRESLGHGFEQICLALSELAHRYPDIQFVYPVHMNPRVHDVVHRMLGHHDNIFLVPPQDYQHFVWLMNNAYLIMTDSGGVQEEAPALGKPVMVLRNVTERPSGRDQDRDMLVGTDREKIIAQTIRLIEDPVYYSEFATARSPFGDGHACERIVKRLQEWKRSQSLDECA
ncbi:non-hydrolyzing UDP-N-acetylglucosamine 2-epimerase [Thalassospira marina]|uniref:UDP-N-acetylglucosamine 2-epimerase (non-hydrolyzing) n=1 Tax=Thalassospira marina TaxID=2048283 RepID=A0ABN5FU94_9PROT|nr:UDP-N-acetylglucosamine 2-epimerase (non-hydrolyzing) [Thalassospira marina]AUG55405.1 UDP-N-acetylglucosamine 2-epimerase (non-hydrolyzing) [Thalassospira marina]